MEKKLKDIVFESLPKNPELKKLYLRHKKLEKEVERFEQYARYSTAAALRHKELKKEKLKGKEEILALIASSGVGSGLARSAV